MVAWRNVVSLLVRPRSLAPNRPTGGGSGSGPVRLPECDNRGLARRGNWPHSAGEGSRLWTIATEFMIEAGSDECSPADRR